jgi:hypothetical protein
MTPYQSFPRARVCGLLSRPALPLVDASAPLTTVGIAGRRAEGGEARQA